MPSTEWVDSNVPQVGIYASQFYTLLTCASEHLLSYVSCTVKCMLIYCISLIWEM